MGWEPSFSPEPTPKGSWKLTTPYKIEYKCDASFSGSTKYTITVPSTLLNSVFELIFKGSVTSINNESLENDFVIHFETPRTRIIKGAVGDTKMMTSQYHEMVNK